MKNFTFLAGLLLSSFFSVAQGNFLIGSYWTGTNEVTRHLNAVTGAFTNLSVLPGATSFAQGESTYDKVNNRYFIKSNLGITVIDGITGAMINVISPSVPLLSIEYNPNTGALLGVYWTGSSEIFASLNLSTGVVTNLGTLTGVTSIVQGESTFDAITNTYFIKTSSGLKVVNAATGAVINTISNTTFKGIEFNPNGNKLVGSYWTGTAEIFASMDLSTGVVSNIATLTGVLSIAQGLSTFDDNGNRYFNTTNLGVTVVDAVTGTILNTIPGMPFTKGIEFIGNTSNPCTLTLTPLPVTVYAGIGGSVNFSAITSGPGVTYQWQSNPSNFGWTNVPNNATYSGGTGTVLTVNAVSLQNHLQPFRVIAITDACSDTSNVSTIHVSDTCIVQDTVHVIITDTLINGLKQNTANTIKIYPNPATTRLTIDNGDLSKMRGYRIRISNGLGQQVFAQDVTEKLMTVDLLLMTGKGLYFLEVVDQDNSVVEARKIIIQ